MSNAYVDPINELYGRLNTAKGTGLLLSDLKTLNVGTREDVLDSVSLPGILIELDTFEENRFEISNKPVGCFLNLLFHLYFPTDNDKAINNFFNFTAKTGILYYITKVLDVLNTTQAGITAKVYSGHRSGGTADPTLAGTCVRAISTEVGNIEKMRDYWAVTIKVQVMPKQFAFNGRSGS